MQALGQDCILDALDPELVQCLCVGFPGSFGAVDLNGFDSTEIQFPDAFVNDALGKLQTLDNPLLNQVVDVETRLQLAGFQGGTEAVSHAGQGVYVLLGQINALTVQVIEIGVEHIAGEFIAYAKITEVCELQLAGDQNVRPGLVNCG